MTTHLGDEVSLGSALSECMHITAVLTCAEFTAVLQSLLKGATVAPIVADVKAELEDPWSKVIPVAHNVRRCLDGPYVPLCTSNDNKTYQSVRGPPSAGD